MADGRWMTRWLLHPIESAKWWETSRHWSSSSQMGIQSDQKPLESRQNRKKRQKIEREREKKSFNEFTFKIGRPIFILYRNLSHSYVFNSMQRERDGESIRGRRGEIHSKMFDNISSIWNVEYFQLITNFIRKNLFFTLPLAMTNTQSDTHKTVALSIYLYTFSLHPLWWLLS